MGLAIDSCSTVSLLLGPGSELQLLQVVGDAQRVTGQWIEQIGILLESDMACWRGGRGLTARRNVLADCREEALPRGSALRRQDFVRRSRTTPRYLILMILRSSRNTGIE